MDTTPRREYHSPDSSPTLSRPERRGVSNPSVIEEAKRRVRTIDFADREKAERAFSGPSAAWERAGEEFKTLCIIPGHEEETASFHVNPRTDLWYCFGCMKGGDCVELARLVWGYEKRAVGTVAALLLKSFGHDVPKRPASYFRKQDRQARARQALEDAKIQRFTRRLYRAFVAPGVAEMPPGLERDAEERRGWDDCELAAKLLVYQDSGEAA
jgi:hypothetical protein